MKGTRGRPLRRSEAAGMPAASPAWLNGFGVYVRWYLRRHFHAMRLSTDGWLPDSGDGVPQVVYLNHASWWDPLVCLEVWHSMFKGYLPAAPIEEAALAKYAFFRRLGFFGVEPGSVAGAATFLRSATGWLSRPWTMLWITPEGAFRDVRERPVRFQSGLGHLAARVGRGERRAARVVEGPSRLRFLPLAIEYTHWHERLPEVLLRFGEPVEVGAASERVRDPEEWTMELARRLEASMDRLGRQACGREAAQFQMLLGGSAGVGGVYDLWRRFKSIGSGKAFDPRHGRL